MLILMYFLYLFNVLTKFSLKCNAECNLKFCVGGDNRRCGTYEVVLTRTYSFCSRGDITAQ